MSLNNISRGPNELRRSTENLSTTPHTQTSNMENDLFTYMKSQFEKLDKKTDDMNNKLDSLGNRMHLLESEVSEVRNEQRVLHQQQQALDSEQSSLFNRQEKQDETMHALQEDVSKAKEAYLNLVENTERLKRSSNIIIHGVVEDSRALQTLTRLMNLLFPKNTLYIRDFRIGIVHENRIRPVKMRLGSANEVDAVLHRASLLKDRSEFKDIYVTRDFTRMQQEDRKKRREEWIKQQQEKQSIEGITSTQNTNLLPPASSFNATPLIPTPASNSLATTVPKRKADQMCTDNTDANQMHVNKRGIHATSPDITNGWKNGTDSVDKLLTDNNAMDT